MTSSTTNTTNTTKPANNHAVETKVPPNPFADLSQFRVDPMGDIEVEKVLTTVLVRKPKRTEFFRVHPSPDFTEDVNMFERSEGMDRESYLVTAAVKHLVASELRSVRLHTVINKHGEVFLWPIKLPSDDHDRLRRMADSALQAAEHAKSLWVKLVWDKHLGAWEMFRAKGDLGEPTWPEKSFLDLMEIAFRGYLIDSPDHVVIREHAGEL